MKDFNRRKKQAQELLAKPEEIIFRTSHLVVDDGGENRRVYHVELLIFL